MNRASQKKLHSGSKENSINTIPNQAQPPQTSSKQNSRIIDSNEKTKYDKSGDAEAAKSLNKNKSATNDISPENINDHSQILAKSKLNSQPKQIINTFDTANDLEATEETIESDQGTDECYNQQNNSIHDQQNNGQDTFDSNQSMLQRQLMNAKKGVNGMAKLLSYESGHIKQQRSSNKKASLDDFEEIKKIGDGAYSQVYKVRRKADGMFYALKRVSLPHFTNKEKQNAINEVRILASVKHPNVIQYKEAFVDEKTQNLCIVMEYANHGDVFQKINRHKEIGTYIKERLIWKIIIQAVFGLQSMHALNIMHRDLKSANIFLKGLNYNKSRQSLVSSTLDFDIKEHQEKDDCKGQNNTKQKKGKQEGGMGERELSTPDVVVAKLGDMNVSKVSNAQGLNYTQTGTPYYASPEVWKDEPYDNKSDVWSLGCVIYEMAALRPPFMANDMQGLFKRLLKGVYPKLPQHFSPDLTHVIDLMLQVNPKKRVTTAQLIQDQTFKKRTQKYYGHLYDAQMIQITPDNKQHNSQSHTIPTTRKHKMNRSNMHMMDNRKMSLAQSNQTGGVQSQRNAVSINQGVLIKTIRIPKNLNMLSGRLPKNNYDQNQSIVDPHEYNLSMMSLGIDLVGIEPGSSPNNIKKMLDIQGLQQSSFDKQQDQINGQNISNKLDQAQNHNKASQESLDPIKIYSQSVQDNEEGAGRIQTIESARKNDLTNLAKQKKDFQLPEIVKTKPQNSSNYNNQAINNSICIQKQNSVTDITPNCNLKPLDLVRNKSSETMSKDSKEQQYRQKVPQVQGTVNRKVDGRGIDASVQNPYEAGNSEFYTNPTKSVSYNNTIENSGTTGSQERNKRRNAIEASASQLQQMDDLLDTDLTGHQMIHQNDQNQLQPNKIQMGLINNSPEIASSLNLNQLNSQQQLQHHKDNRKIKITLPKNLDRSEILNNHYPGTQSTIENQSADRHPLSVSKPYSKVSTKFQQLHQQHNQAAGGSMVFDGKIYNNPPKNQSASRAHFSGVQVQGGDQQQAQQHSSSSRLLIQNQPNSISLQKLGQQQRFKRNHLQSIDTKDNSHSNSNIIGKSEIQIVPATPSKKKNIKKYKLSYENNNRSHMQEKSPEFARFAGGNSHRNTQIDGSMQYIENLNEQHSVDSLANIIQTGNEKNRGAVSHSKGQFQMNQHHLQQHELIPRPQQQQNSSLLLPIGSESSIGRDDLHLSNLKDKNHNHQIQRLKNDSIDPQIQGQIRNIAQILQKRQNQRSNLVPPRNQSQISDIIINNKSINGTHEDQNLNLRHYLNQQKLRQQQRAIYLGKKNGISLNAANSIQRSSLVKMAAESNQTPGLSNSLNHQNNHQNASNSRIIVNNNQISIGQLVFASSPNGTLVPSDQIQQSQGNNHSIGNRQGFSSNTYGDSKKHRAVMSVIQQQIPTSVSGVTLQALDQTEPSGRPNISNMQQNSTPGIKQGNYRSISIPKLQMNQYQNSIAAIQSSAAAQMPLSTQHEQGPSQPQQSSLTSSSLHLHNYSQRLIERANRDRAQLELIKGKVVSKLTPLRGAVGQGALASSVAAPGQGPKPKGQPSL